MLQKDLQDQYKFIDKKVIIRLKGRACETSEELLASELFREVVLKQVRQLERKESPLMVLFGTDRSEAVTEKQVDDLIRVLQVLEQMPLEWAVKVFEDKRSFLDQPEVLYEYIERLYDFWREFERFIVCDSEGDVLDKRPYRTFNATIESLTHLVRSTYRHIQENISGMHPSIYRQVSAGAEIAAIALPKSMQHLEGPFEKLKNVPVIRQVLLHPPLLVNPPMNKRTGSFVRVDQNPLEQVEICSEEWLCYPARVGEQLILVYFHERFFELGFALCNLFELADDESLQKKADAVFLYGVPEGSLNAFDCMPTVFYDDTACDLLVGAIPCQDEYGYFGYLKKMILTLHNIKVMKTGHMPFHGAMMHLRLRGGQCANLLIFGDTGAGKSETLEAFRKIGADEISEMTVIADDMGSLDMGASGNVVGYGTEVGAFVRLDDLPPGYAFGQLDRAIIMNPGVVNARVILPVTTYENIVRGYPVDMILYANNYEMVDDEHPVLEQITSPEQALQVFREGTAMSKGTTSSTGLVHTYFVNVFGPQQYTELHDEIAKQYFEQFYRKGLFVGQLRTRLGVGGWERKGPEEAAARLLEVLKNR